MTAQDTGSGKEPPPTAATRGYMDAATQMHLDMNVHYTGDADKDFAAVIAAHNKGAVALARIELAHGTDPDMRKLAEAVIAGSEKDAAAISVWQAAHP